MPKSRATKTAERLLLLTQTAKVVHKGNNPVQWPYSHQEVTMTSDNNPEPSDAAGGGGGGGLVGVERAALRGSVVVWRLVYCAVGVVLLCVLYGLQQTFDVYDFEWLGLFFFPSYIMFILLPILTAAGIAAVYSLRKYPQMSSKAWVFHYVVIGWAAVVISDRILMGLIVLVW
jgi:hypothetical protein